MRGSPAHHEVQSPKTLAAAAAVLAREPGVWTALAGGTDLMVVYESGGLKARALLNIAGLRELQGIRTTATHIEIGALATFTEIQRHAGITAAFPGLVQAARETGGIAIQSRGTLGGNIANASPAADSPPALLAYDAEIELVSAAGTRRLPYHGFHTAYKQTVMRPDELIRAILLPLSAAPRQSFYRKVGTRRAQAISKVVLAATAQRSASGVINSVRIAYGSVAPMTLRCVATEAEITGKKITAPVLAATLKALQGELVPIDDIRSTRTFRQAVAANILRSFLDSLV